MPGTVITILKIIVNVCWMLDKIMSNKEDSVSRTTHMLNTEGPVTEKVSEN